MNEKLLDSLEFIYEHPEHLFLLFVDTKSDLERMRSFFPDVPVFDGSDPDYATQCLRAFREGRVRGIVLTKSLTVGWNVRPPENAQVAVLFGYIPGSDEYEQASYRIRPLNQKELNHEHT